MRAVWSFWTRPFRAHHHRLWPSEAHHLLAWVLSVQTARQHFESTCLVTDDDGARMLVDGIGLEFDHVSTELNALADEDPDWWCLGKLYAYRAQAEPFVHIDSDCFLWRPLRERLRAADLVAQHPEWFPYEGPSYYRPGVLEAAVDAAGGWLPDALRRYTLARGGGGVNCGILGGRRVEFIREYADLGIRLVQHPANRAAWVRLADKRDHENVAVEQRLLAACIAEVRANPASPYHDLDVQYVFASLDDALDPEHAARAGFTHLIGHTKSDPAMAGRLAARVRREYPDYYGRCARYGSQRAEAPVETAVLQEV